MPWNGIGQYVLPPAFSPEVNGTVIDALRYNGLTSDVATGITQSLNKNGENVPTANISWGGFKLTNLAQAAANGDALAWGQNASIANLTITGTFTPSAQTPFPLGAVGAPSITFLGDLNTGMWSSGADIINWSTGGVSSMQLGSNALALGTNFVFASQLGAVGAPGYSFIGDLNTGMWSPAADNLAWSIGGIHGMRLDNLGRVAIGTVASAGGDLEIIRAAGDPYFRITNGTVQAYMQASNSGGLIAIGSLSNHPIAFIANSAEKARLAANGFFGIGTTPANIFHVKGSGQVGRFESTTARGSGLCYIDFYDPTGAKGEIGYGAAADDFYVTNILAGAMNIGVSNATRLQITSASVVKSWDGAALQEIGYRDLINGGASYLGNTQRGQLCAMTANITLNTADNVTANSVITIFNNTTGALSIIQGAGMSLFKSGTAGAAGTRTILPRGLVTLWFLSTTIVICGGDCS